ncbi:MAG TPA: hypothetical protein PKU84_04000 [Spirochaetota bacterium]|nr:hypothetical protein [Spirochaetota bacterium]HPK55638.1 hypothetical protein [Spirochaetota bacterium]
MKNIRSKLFFLFSAFVFVFFLLLYLLFLLLMSQETRYVDADGNDYSGNKYFRVYYLHRIISAHWTYPDTGRESLMTEFQIIDDNIKDPVIKNLEYELYHNDVLISPTTYSLSMTTGSMKNLDYRMLNSRLSIDKDFNDPTVYVIIDGVNFYHRHLKLKYNFIVEDASGEYSISGTKLLTRRISKEIDF